ncbi:MFS transporter [Pantanalinema sp. GBBB05]|uniref:MFS transporter n=1 Tax=Pantanalinema sp. GBBB05 TaxID=2604139 RepID=UPI001DD08E41|nr:MFS transporter [Pantanalinema sp. GBBB05]
MIQLSNSNLESAVLLSSDPRYAGDRQKPSPSPSGERSSNQLSAPELAAEQTNSNNLHDRPVLAQDIPSNEENSSLMFRSEEDILPPPDEMQPTDARTPDMGDRASQSSFAPATLDALANLEDEAGDNLEPESGFLPVLRNRQFLTLWSGQVFSQLADKVYLVLMIALIASRFQAEDQTISGWVSSIMIAFTIPAVLFGSIAGALVDRWSKPGVLVVTNLLRGGLVFALPFLLWLTKGWTPIAGLPVGFWILLAITFLVSTLTQFFAPAEQAAIPLIVERRHLLSANSLYTTTMMASVIIGFAVGEPLLAIADHLMNYFGWTAVGLGKELIVGSGYAIAGLILILLLKPDAQRRRQSNQATAVNGNGAITAEQPHIWQDIRDGLRYLGQQRRVRSALIQLVILFSVFAALAVLAVRLAEVIPEIKSSQFGFLLAAGGVGMAIGATFIGQYGQRFPHAQLSLYGSIGMAASLFGLALFAQQLVPALLLISSLGAFAALVGVPMQTTIQEETPEDMHGKVFGLQNNAINIALSLPLALAGVAETFLGLSTVFTGLALLVVAGGVITWYVSRSKPE